MSSRDSHSDKRSRHHSSRHERTSSRHGHSRDKYRHREDVERGNGRHRRRSRSRSPTRHRKREDGSRSPSRHRTREDRSRSPTRHRKREDEKDSLNTKPKESEETIPVEEQKEEDDIILAKLEALKKRQAEIYSKHANDSKSKISPTTPLNRQETQATVDKGQTIDDIDNDGEDDLDDMFSEDFDATQTEIEFNNTKSKTSGQNLKDNWDDEDGYYRVKLGEVIQERYTVFGFTGQGVFSNVVRARDRTSDDQLVAVKILRNNRVMYKAGEKELQILQRLRDRDPQGKHHCVRLLDNFVHRNHFCLVFENLSMDLREVLKKYGHGVGLHLRAVQSYSHQLLYALRLLEKSEVIHADIKPDNILLDDSKKVAKLCDFGSASFVHENEITPYLVSRFYRAPEIMLGLKYSYGIDMWSMACTIYEMATGQILFRGVTNNDMLKLIADLKGKYSAKLLRKSHFRDQHFTEDHKLTHREIDKVTKLEKTTILDIQHPTRDLMQELVGSSKPTAGERRHLTLLKDLLEQMLVVDPDKRISVKESLRHPFITEKYQE